MKEKNIFNRILSKIKQNPGMFIQRTLFIVALIVTLSFFVYTLLFSSNWAKIITNNDKHSGYQFFVESQSFNDLIFLLSALTVLVVLFAFAFSTGTRIKYYLSNIVLSIVLAASMIVNSVILFINLPGLRAMYNKIDPYAPEYVFGDVSKWTANGKVKSDNIFVVGIVFAVIMVIVAISIITILVFKLKAQKERNQIIAKMVNVNE